MPEDKQYKVVNGTYYDARTPQEVIDILEHSRRTHNRLLIIYGDPVSGKVFDTPHERGRIGRSTGQKPIPLLVKTARSLGGGALLDYCIIEIRTSPGNRVLYKRNF